jgi:hypothetical protein
VGEQVRYFNFKAVTVVFYGLMTYQLRQLFRVDFIKVIMFGELQGTEKETVMAYFKVTLRRLLTVHRKSKKDTSQDM